MCVENGCKENTVCKNGVKSFIIFVQFHISGINLRGAAYICPLRAVAIQQ